MMILFNSSWEPSIFLNGETNEEKARLQEIADKITVALRDGENEKTWTTILKIHAAVAWKADRQGL